MKNVLIISLIFILGACASTSETTNTINEKGETVIDTSNANIHRVSNEGSELVPYDVNSNGAEPKITRIKPDIKDNPQEKTAPDNSIFESKLDKNGFTATRTFRDHPKILKVEKTQNGDVKTFKVHLKNGKVYDVTDKKLPNFRYAAPANILDAIGLLPKTAPVKENPQKIKELEQRTDKESETDQQLVPKQK